MSAVHKYMTAEAAQAIRNAIADAQEREVFLIGHPDADGVVVAVDVLARGNATSVTAVTQFARFGDVAIHNHPSGVLEPSDADVTLASLMALEGIATIIVNNDVTAVYVVVEPMQPPKRVPLDEQHVLSLLAADGAMAQTLNRYEDRPAQQDMTREVIAAFNHDKISVIEAGTGTGKTLAYLLPAVLWALQNEERVVVATHTINLQEQIMHKDLPLLRTCLGRDFRAVLVKGRGNYVCLRKVHMIEDEPELFEDEDSDELHALINWALTTRTGDLADVPFHPKMRVWEKIASSGESCFRAHCPFFKECFVVQARRNAASAQLLVTNHAMLFADLAFRAHGNGASDSSVLPKYRRIIFDEAHNLEDVATDQFTAAVSRRFYQRTLSLLYRRTRAREIGALTVLSTQLLRCIAALREPERYNVLLDALDTIVATTLPALQYAVDDCFDAVTQELSAATNEGDGAVQVRITPERRASELWTRGIAHLRTLMQATRAFVNAIAAVVKDIGALEIEDDKLNGALLDVTGYCERLTSFADTLDAVCTDDSDEFVVWFESRPLDTTSHVSVNRAPLVIAETMIANVYEAFPTIVMTSATLTSRKRFDFLEARIGLAEYKQRLRGSSAAAGQARPVTSLLLPTPFDYRNQALIVIPTDLDAAHIKTTPAHGGQSLRDTVLRLLRTTRGSAFVLFTSYGLLRKVAAELGPDLAADGMNVFVQGTEQRDALLKRFRTAAHAVLFGTDSFWAGVDVVGDALQSVIITKLPFRVPTEPIVEARVEYIDQHGGNAFREYTVPLAVIKLRQGFGRLIRSKTDYGVVAILDRRVLDKYYGKWFLESLPDCTRAVGSLDDVEAHVRAFFDSKRTPEAAPRTRRRRPKAVPPATLQE